MTTTPIGPATTSGHSHTQHLAPLVYRDDDLLAIYRTAKTVAMVGASPDWNRPSYFVMKYLLRKGYTVIPVNPRAAGGEILGQRVYASLAEIPEPIDVVDVFRPSAETPDIARQAVEIGARVLWLQVGIESDEARRIAEAGGLTVVMNRCLGATHRRLGLGPGPD